MTQLRVLFLLFLSSCAHFTTAFTGPCSVRKPLTQQSTTSHAKSLGFSNELAREVQFRSHGASGPLYAVNDDVSQKSKVPFWLDPGTKGGAVVLTIVLFVVPILFYMFVTGVLGFDEIEAGKWIGIGFTVVATLAWVSTYLFRVATKDMTYVSSILLMIFSLLV
jgi:hypothetical protein